MEERRRAVYKKLKLDICPHCGETRNRIDEMVEWSPTNVYEAMCPRRTQMVGWECENCGDFEEVDNSNEYE